MSPTLRLAKVVHALNTMGEEADRIWPKAGTTAAVTEAMQKLRGRQSRRRVRA